MLGIESMRVADGALREGLLYDLVGRLTDEDARARSVRSMEGRFHVDAAQADRVEATALAFLRQVRETWDLRRAARRARAALGGEAARNRPRHRALRSTTGTARTCCQYGDMPGFPREEQRLLAVLVGGHRRKLNREQYEDLVPPWHLKAESLVVLLRLAVLLHRGRGPRSLPEIDLRRAWPLTGTDVPEGLARGASADRGRPRAGGRLPARRRLPPASRLTCDAGAARADCQRLASCWPRSRPPVSSSFASDVSACERNSARYCDGISVRGSGIVDGFLCSPLMRYS